MSGTPFYERHLQRIPISCARSFGYYQPYGRSDSSAFANPFFIPRDLTPCILSIVLLTLSLHLH